MVAVTFANRLKLIVQLRPFHKNARSLLLRCPANCRTSIRKASLKPSATSPMLPRRS